MDEALLELLIPIVRAVQIKDSDTLSRYRKDDEIILRVSGSWTGSATISFGDLRKIAKYFSDNKIEFRKPMINSQIKKEDT